MLKPEDIFVGASYEMCRDGERWVATIVQHYGGDVCYSSNLVGTTLQRCAVMSFIGNAVRRVYPCTVYLPAPEGSGLLENQLPATPVSAPREDDPICVCDNCEYEARQQTLPPAQDIYSRLSIGDIFSDVECPECHALCYPKQDKTIKLVPEHDGREQMMKNVKWLTDHFYVLQRLLGLKLKGGWVTTVEDVMRELHVRFAPVAEEDIPLALRALMDKTKTTIEDWVATDGPRSGVGEDYYYQRCSPVDEVWWVCVDQGEVTQVERESG